MCGYSLELEQTRTARQGDLLTTAAFGNHGSIGMVSADEPGTAVCLLPGSRLRVTGVPGNLAAELAISPGDLATFQTDASGTGYVDGLRFDHHVGPGSGICKLQDLLIGLSVEVVQVPAEPASAAGTKPASARAPARELEPA